MCHKWESTSIIPYGHATKAEWMMSCGCIHLHRPSRLLPLKITAMDKKTSISISSGAVTGSSRQLKFMSGTMCTQCSQLIQFTGNLCRTVLKGQTIKNKRTTTGSYQYTAAVLSFWNCLILHHLTIWHMHTDRHTLSLSEVSYMDTLVHL